MKTLFWLKKRNRFKIEMRYSQLRSHDDFFKDLFVFYLYWGQKNPNPFYFQPKSKNL